MNILVTGCAGFIGSHLCEKLLANNFSVVGIDNFDSFYSREIKNDNLSHFLHHPNFSFIELDLTNKIELFKLDKFDVVVHLAAKAGVRPSIEYPLEYIKHNIEANQNILDFLVEKNITKYIFASSSSIYGNTKQIPFTEEDPCNNAISPYAYTKKAGEIMNYTYHNLYQIDIINLRFFTVFGPRQRPDLAIHKFVHLIKEGNPIEMYGDGSTARDYTYIDDIVSGIFSSINYVNNNNKVFEHFNIGNHYPVALKDLIKTIYNALNLPPNILEKEQQKGEVDITFANISKAKKILKYNPQTKFEDGIKQFVKWYEEKTD